MSDLPVQPVLNYGQMLGSYGDSLATQQNAQTNQLSARAQLPQIQVSTALTSAQAQGADLANQKSATQLALLQSLINPPVVNDQSAVAGTSSTPGSGQAPPPAAGAGDASGAAPSGSDSSLALDDGGFTPAHVAAGIQQQFAVRDTWTPQELQRLQQAPLYAAAGIPGMDQVVMQQHNARITTATNQAQLGASAAYDQAYAVSTAPPDHALATLQTIHPDAAAAIRKIAEQKNWTDDQTDQFVRTYADEVGNAAHRYSGRVVEVGKDGVARDATTNQPVLGGAPAGLTPEAHADLVQKANTLTDTYRAGVTTKQYVNAAASRSDGTVPLPPRLANTPLPPRNAPPAPGGSNAASGTAGPQSTDPVLRQALADPTYKYAPPKIPAGQAMDPDSTAKIAATNEARKALLQDSQDATATAAQSLQYLNAAKSIMDSKGANVGAYGNLIAQASRFLPGQSVDATNYQEVAKYLGNAALANAKAVYGQRMTQSEVGLQLNELSPSTKMTPQAINNLINTNARSAQYTIDSAQRTRQFLATGGDPQQFGSWNQQYFPREKIVNATPAANAGAAGAPVRVQSRAQAMALKPGTTFMTPDGRTLVR
jgi:hypothetical protein